MAILGNILKQTILLKKTIDRINPTDKPHRVQRRTLKKLLKKARHTQFGTYYNFDTLLKSRRFVKEFQNTVGTFDYNSMHDQWWHKAIAEEEDVCWPGKINYFALSSGTSGAPSKYIPVTKDQIKAMRRAGFGTVLSLAYYNNLSPNFFAAGFLTIGGSTDLTKEKSYYKGDLSGITVGNIPLWMQPFKSLKREITDEKDWGEKIEKIVANAPNWNIGTVCGVPAWIQIIFEKIIERYSLTTIHDLWPNLKVFIHGGVSYEPYRKAFEKLVAEPLICIDTYLASEGFVAYCNRPTTSSMKLVLNNGIFFEFVPFNDTNFDADGNMVKNPETLLLNEVQEGVDYAILISTCAGAWRYLIGDTVRFTSVELAEIVITGRTKHYLSLCGEHTSVDNMNSAIKAVADKYNLSIPEYTVTGLRINDQFYHKWYIGTNDSTHQLDLKTVIDDTLKLVNDDYITERNHALKDIYIEVLPVETFYEWMRKNGKEGGQHKFPRVLKGTQQKDWEEFLAARQK